MIEVWAIEAIVMWGMEFVPWGHNYGAEVIILNVVESQDTTF